MKSSFWVLCCVTLLCFGSVRCSRQFSDNDENSLDTTRNEERTLKEEDTERELYKAKNTWNDITNEITELLRMQRAPEDVSDEDCDDKFSNCINTGGKCSKESDGTIKCNCKEPIKYDATIGCKDTDNEGEGGNDGDGEDDNGDEVSDEDCDKTFSKCINTRGKCSKESDGTIKCNCKGPIAYDGTTGCNVPDDMCYERYHNCKETGGSCSVNAEETDIECDCKAGITYDETTFCNVPNGMCDEKYPKCRDTRGSCSVNAEETDIKCDCKAEITYDKTIACNVPDDMCDEKYPECRDTGGSCSVNVEGTDIKCDCKVGITYDNTTACNVPDEMCDEKYPECRNTGGSCSVGDDGTDIKCNCKAGITYDETTFCNVPDNMCDEEYSKCRDTGGSCTVDDDGTKIKCNCKAGITYDEIIGCNVPDEMCNDKYPECQDTGGSCNVSDDGTNIKCNCKAGIIYDETTFCNVPDDMCNKKHPKCKETKGECQVERNTVTCNCPKDLIYSKTTGCAEDKCIGKCGIPYNKPNNVLKCVNGPFGDVDCKCKNTTLEFDSSEKTCKVHYCEENCGNDRKKIRCEGDIFDKNDVKCVCEDTMKDFIEDEKSCKTNYCRKVCGTAERVECSDKESPYKNTKPTCTCDDEDDYLFINKTKICTKKCKDDCENEGSCEGKEGKKICKCKDGTTGDLCETITACEKGGKYEKCMDDKGKCEFKDGNPNCVCEEDSKKLVDGLNYCVDKCETDDNCGGNKKCNTTHKYCECKDGYEGDDCDVVTGCKTLNAICEKIGKKNCIFDKDAPGKATCECEEGYKYNPTTKKCSRPCSKDGKCGDNSKCDAGFCVCEFGYEGDDCDVITGCKDLKKKCDEIKTACIFDKASKKATCECKEGYTYNLKENKCQHKFCYPVNPCPQTANCTIDESTGIGYCQCPENQYYNYVNKKCQAFADKCLLRKTQCEDNHECNDGKCVCKYPMGEDKICKPTLCKPNPCVTGANCSETDGSCFCDAGKYFNGKECKVLTCNLKEYKKSCPCPPDTERKDGSDECVPKKGAEKCNLECGYGLCVKRGNSESCKCFSFATGGKCSLKKMYCASRTTQGQLQDNNITCKCEGIYKQADDGITCILKTCDDDDVKKECAAAGGECVMDWKGKGYNCQCPPGYDKENGKCTDLCSTEKVIKECASKKKFCYNSYSSSKGITSTCRCPPTTKEVNGACSGKAEYSYLIQNIPVLKKMYKLNSGINKVLLNAHLIESLQQTFKTDLLEYGYLYDYNVQGDVIYCSVWLNFKSAPDATELEKIKMAAKKFSNLCDECDDAVVWPPHLLLSDNGLTKVETNKQNFCKVKDRLCGRGASCVEDKNNGNGKCFCKEGYKLIEYSITMIGPHEVQRCEDINECTTGTHKCAGNTNCRNTDGDYSCVCKDGFKKKENSSDPETDKSDCVDMCTNSPCKKGKCVLKGKTFDCQCQAGAAGSFCDREDENYKSAKKSTVVVGAVLGTILAVGAVAVLYYIIKQRGGICEE